MGYNCNSQPSPIFNKVFNLVSPFFAMPLTNESSVEILEMDSLSLTNKPRSNTIETSTTSASSSPCLSCTPASSNNPPSFSLEDTTAWVAPASLKSLRTHNPIRAIVDPIVSNSIKCGKERGDGKDQISLALGDPTAYGNIPPCPTIIKAITDTLHTHSMAAGYVNACGTPEARAAIAKHHGTTGDNVIVANGASGALELALTALLDEDSVLLVPRPGFPLYSVIAESHGASIVHYDLLPQSGWECDLDQVESILSEYYRNRQTVKQRVRGILINNPSNPTGAVYSREHLAQIARLAARYRIPIVSDEIYGDMTLDGHVFHPMADVVKGLGDVVPVITASGIGKQYLVPGWRLGWIVFHDSHHGAVQEVKKGAQRLAQVILGASHLAQVAIPAVLNPSSDEDELATLAWKKKLHSTIQNQANLLCNLLNTCHGLEVIPPQGAMYAMVKIDIDKFDEFISDDVSFMRLLLEEENIVILPGRAFGMDGNSCGGHVFRVVFCAPEDVVRAAVDRIFEFCLRHEK